LFGKNVEKVGCFLRHGLLRLKPELEMGKTYMIEEYFASKNKFAVGKKIEH
jgi:hypothetical protein